MSVIYSFSAKPEQMPAIQRAVKQHGMWFRNNPAAFMHHGIVWVEVQYDGEDPSLYRQGMAAIDAIRCPEPEPPPAPKRGWLTRLLPQALQRGHQA